jgi:hypothetical protein
MLMLMLMMFDGFLLCMLPFLESLAFLVYSSLLEKYPVNGANEHTECGSMW